MWRILPQNSHHETEKEKMKTRKILNLFFPILLIACILVQSFLFSADAAGSKKEWLMGDVDSDSEVTVLDVTCIQRILAQILSADKGMLTRGRVCGNDTLSVIDATVIQKFLAKLPYQGTVNEIILLDDPPYVSILGASISTFSGYIPEGNISFYPRETANPNPVTDVHDTYWQRFIDSIDGQLLINNSDCGTCCTTGHGADKKAGCGIKCESLDNGVDMPDVIVIQLGGNDFTRSTPIGSYDGTQEFPTQTDTFREAYAVMLKKITEKYEDAVVICETITMIRGGNYVTNDYPPRNKPFNSNPGGIELEEYNNAIREIAPLFGCRVAEFARCGITFDNIPTYMQDYSQRGNLIYGQHPNRAGHALMADELLKAYYEE